MGNGDIHLGNYVASINRGTNINTIIETTILNPKHHNPHPSPHGYLISAAQAIPQQCFPHLA